MSRSTLCRVWLIGVAWCWVTALGAHHSAFSESVRPADLVILDAKIYTVDPSRSVAQGLAVRGGKIVFVGVAADARRYVGPHTRVESLGGRLVLPGLFDSHVHPIGMIHVESCDLGNTSRTLREINQAVRACLTRFPVSEGGWLTVRQWNPYGGNQPDGDFPTLVAALDGASTQVAIQLLGTDGHHGAFNSAALRLARNAKGEAIGLSKATLAGEFAAYRNYVGVDAGGNPNGAVNEAAKALMGGPGILSADFAQALKARAQVPQLLNSVGITGILDAKVDPELLVLYDSLDRDGALSFRTNIAQYYSPERFTLPDGHIDYPTMVASARKIRAKYANHPLIRADIVKLFADGVMEGNPYALPPTLPNSLSLHPYLQPIFDKDREGRLTVAGYVDTSSPLCHSVREHPANYDDATSIGEFTRAHGFHPGQCTASSGQLSHDRTTIMDFVKEFHRAGFTLHIHAIDDGAVRVSLDALEAARASDGVSTQHDGLAHVQLVAPEDVVRIGRDHLYTVFTYSWAYADPGYDMTVIPFIDRVTGNSYEALHSPDGYYERNAYPFKAVKQAGGTLVAGSDAPVETASPRPFVNMAMATTRRLPGKKAQNPAQAIGIRDVIDAYTINGARFLNRDSEAGSLETGKSADFIVLDRDILALADAGRNDDIATTRVLETWFAGKAVYVGAAQ